MPDAATQRQQLWSSLNFTKQGPTYYGGWETYRHGWEAVRRRRDDDGTAAVERQRRREMEEEAKREAEAERDKRRVLEEQEEKEEEEGRRREDKERQERRSRAGGEAGSGDGAKEGAGPQKGPHSGEGAPVGAGDGKAGAAELREGASEKGGQPEQEEGRPSPGKHKLPLLAAKPLLQAKEAGEKLVEKGKQVLSHLFHRGKDEGAATAVAVQRQPSASGSGGEVEGSKPSLGAGEGVAGEEENKGTAGKAGEGKEAMLEKGQESGKEEGQQQQQQQQTAAEHAKHGVLQEAGEKLVEKGKAALSHLFHRGKEEGVGMTAAQQQQQRQQQQNAPGNVTEGSTPSLEAGEGVGVEGAVGKAEETMMNNGQAPRKEKGGQQQQQHQTAAEHAKHGALQEVGEKLVEKGKAALSHLFHRDPAGHAAQGTERTPRPQPDHPPA